MGLVWGLFLVVLNSSLALLDQRRSVKALAAVLNSRLHPSDEVASYHAYYEDLPVYLQRPVAVVGWKGNLQFRVEVNERSGGWITDDAWFWKRWNSPATVYMLTEQGTYDKLRSESSFKFRVVAQGLYDVLLSNKTTWLFKRFEGSNSRAVFVLFAIEGLYSSCDEPIEISFDRQHGLDLTSYVERRENPAGAAVSVLPWLDMDRHRCHGVFCRFGQYLVSSGSQRVVAGTPVV